MFWKKEQKKHFWFVRRAIARRACVRLDQRDTRKTRKFARKLRWVYSLNDLG